MRDVMDFARPVQLKGCRDADAYVRGAWGMKIGIAFGICFVSFFVLAFTTQNPVVSYLGAPVVAVALTAFILRRKRAVLRRRFAEQTLELSPSGLVRADDCAYVEMAWSGLVRVAQQDSAIPLAGLTPGGRAYAGALNAARADVSLALVGNATVTPAPGAPRGLLMAMDRATGSRLARGQQHVGLSYIFPAEYEENWTDGVIGAWVRHYRPDVLP